MTPVSSWRLAWAAMRSARTLRAGRWLSAAADAMPERARSGAAATAGAPARGLRAAAALQGAARCCATSVFIAKRRDYAPASPLAWKGGFVSLLAGFQRG